MTLDAQSGFDDDMAGMRLADLGKFYRAGRVLVALPLFAIGLSCAIEPWMGHAEKPSNVLMGCYELTGAALFAAALGIAVGRGTRVWAPMVGAAALLLSIFCGGFHYRELAGLCDGPIRVALIGALLMLAGIARHGEGQISRWFKAGRKVFAVGALVCVATEALISAWLKSGIDMFYFQYDSVTFFNSIWAWTHPLAWIFGPLAMLGAALLLFRRTARFGAICLATANILFLPLFFLYRSDDFCGGGWAIVELVYAWILGLGLAGGALIVASTIRQTDCERSAGLFFRRRWVRAAFASASVVLLAPIVLHGLIPFFFYEANSRGNAKWGDRMARVWAKDYIPASGNSIWDDKFIEGVASAGPDGRSCAAGEAQGCSNFAGFYYQLGWNWGRKWRIFEKAAALFAAPCDSGDTGACLSLGIQYEEGDGVPADRGRAATFYQKACDDQVGEACVRLGDLYWYGIGLAQDKPRGLRLIEKGCDLGSKSVCGRVHSLDKFYREPPAAGTVR